MKIIHTVSRLILSILISSLFMTSCTADIEMAEDILREKHTVKMTLSCSILDFDAVSTRSTSTEWEEGDIIYLRFQTSNGVVTGTATYDNNEEWIVSYNGTLDKNSEMNVEVTYFDDATLVYQDSVVHLTANTAIFQDTEAKSIFISNDDLLIDAYLKPQTSRIKFKGNPNEVINVGGIETMNCYNLNEGKFAKSDSTVFVKATVNQLGYTDYLYGICSDNTTPRIKINKQEEDSWDYLYTLNCRDNIMAIGKSGWMNIPTPTKRNGWAMKKVSGEENGHMWVDLGLPSGTKWADENVGADITQWQEDGKESNVFGKDYYWGETSEHTGYEEFEDIQGSDSYDTAKWNWKGKWVMPSLEDYEELLQYCSFKIVNNAYGTINTVEARGSSGEFIYFPYDKNGSGMTYWTSKAAISLIPNGGSAFVFDIDNLGNYKLTTASRYTSELGFTGTGSANRLYSFFYANLRAITK